MGLEDRKRCADGQPDTPNKTQNPEAYAFEPSSLPIRVGVCARIIRPQMFLAGKYSINNQVHERYDGQSVWDKCQRDHGAEATRRMRLSLLAVKNQEYLRP
jgi:hypothetical protein